MVTTKSSRHHGAGEMFCHPERSEGSAVPVADEQMQILRFAQNDTRALQKTPPLVDQIVEFFPYAIDWL